MQDATTLEGIFNEIKDSVERLDSRVAGVERRVIIISQEVDRECKGDKIILAVPANLIMWGHLALGVIIAIIALRVIHCIYVHGGI